MRGWSFWRWEECGGVCPNNHTCRRKFSRPRPRARIVRRPALMYQGRAKVPGRAFPEAMHLCFINSGCHRRHGKLPSSARAPSFCDQLLQSIEVTFVTSDLIWSQRCAIPFLQMQSMHMNAPATREFSESMFWRLKVQNSKRFRYHCFSRSIALRFAAGKQMGRFQLPNEAAREGRPARSGTSGAACLMQCRCLFFGSSRNCAIAPHH